MQQWNRMALTTALFLSACTTGDNNTYYELPFKAVNTVATVYCDSREVNTCNFGGVMDENGSSSTVHSKKHWIVRVSVADFLAGNGLVYQTSDVQYATARSNLWASPLEQQLQRTLVANLSTEMPNIFFSTQQTGNDTDRLSVTITGFHGRHDGRAVVQGDWLLTHDGCVIQKSFNLALMQEKDGYDALTRTLALAWNKVGQQMAKDFVATIH
ncbi:membrane integrity-associated transporter subunit PqiC [Candidatus Steffania adelgidicola]|uniref:membrane integrity-associated transporter subunit PqiC n=1 Tax=Candidatus Steffania adelgidicola TaxID=1076626 RepID=UPI001D020CD9|nr:membrane integrity-associated transporter subunit PqiC [Candidatus Steffania adelgidicola]UDG79882.1 hypothetical protein GFK82_00425 [Candidatus Steffania adelgidicola]